MEISPTWIAINKQVLNLVKLWNVQNYNLEIRPVYSSGIFNHTFIVTVRGLQDNTQFTKKIFVKCSPADKLLRETHQIKICFEIEIFAYRHLLPGLMLIREEIYSEGVHLSVPSFLGGQIEENLEIVILEYLSDYKTLPFELYSTDKVNIKAFVKALSEFHALSLAFKIRKPEEYSQLISTLQSISNPRDEYWERLMMFACDLAIRAMDSVLKVELLSKIRDNLNHLYDNSNKEITNKIIVHGDCHLWNFVYKNEMSSSKSAANTLLLDYQMMTPSSPAYDLHYLCACVLETKELQITDLQDTYFEQVKKSLKALRLDIDNIYPRDQFDNDMHDFAFVTLVTSTVAYMHNVIRKDNSPERNVYVDIMTGKATDEDIICGAELERAKSIINRKVDQIISVNPQLLSI